MNRNRSWKSSSWNGRRILLNESRRAFPSSSLRMTGIVTGPEGKAAATPEEDLDLTLEVLGFGVSEKTLGLRDSLLESDGEELGKPEEFPTLRPQALLRFVAPTLALWIAPPVMSLVDTSVVGRFCGAMDLAALSPGCTLIDSSSYLFMFIATAATNMIASARADGDETACERIVSEALFLALISGLFLATLVFLFGQPMMMVIAGKQSASVVPSALKYSLIRAFGQPFVVMASVARASALAKKDTLGPLLSVAMAFLLNAVGTIALVKNTNLGIMGAAIGTLVADIAATAFLLARIRTSRQKENVGNNDDKCIKPLIVIPTLDNFQKFVQYATPIFFTILGKSVVYNGVALSVGRLGEVALAAHQVLLKSFFFWTPVGDSVGMTSQVFLPGILAEEKRTGVAQGGAKRLLFTLGVVAGLVAATLAGLLPSKGSGLFTTDIHVAAILKLTSPILALGVSMHAIALTCEGMLLAQRDLGFLSSTYVITTIATAVLLLSPFRPATLGGSWWVLAFFQGSRAIQFALRNLWISRWKTSKEA